MVPSILSTMIIGRKYVAIKLAQLATCGLYPPKCQDENSYYQRNKTLSYLHHYGALIMNAIVEIV